MRQDLLTPRQRLAERLRERGDPLLDRAVILLHRLETLVVDVDPIKPVVLEEFGHRGARADRVRA